jgi:CMP/dCMP kinase
VIVAVDGPAGAGKSTVAKAVAERLGFTHLDTGAMYRAVALACLEGGASPDDQDAVTRTARDLDLRIVGNRVLIGDRDVTQRVRQPDVTAIVSQVAALPGVRSSMAGHQRRAAADQDVVVEGRDIGSFVFPEADVKVFLTASLAARARRRARQEGLPEDDATLARIRDSIARRDAADAGRAESPLARAPDAVLIDSTEKPLTEVVNEVVALVPGHLRG